MRLAMALLLTLPAAILADEPPPRPSAKMLQEHPAAFVAGSCVEYHEGGAGQIIVEPTWYVRGRVVAAEVRRRPLPQCPEAPAGGTGRDDRAAFNRLALAWPCAGPGETAREERIGIVRMAVADWETPHERRAAAAGRLWRGYYIDRELRKDMEIELEADLVGACER